MAAPPMRTVTAAGIELIVVELCDRRHGLGNPIREWCFQSELENYLYSNWQTRGSFFQLLARPSGHEALDHFRAHVQIRRLRESM